MKRIVLLSLLLSLGFAQSTQNKVGLGSPLATFTAKFGAPFRNVGKYLYDYQKCPGRSQLAQWSVTSEDGALATVITHNACPPNKLDASTSDAQAKLFFPSDAVQARTFRTGDGWAAQAFRSETLGRTFPPEFFKSCEGTEPLGTFSYLLSPERAMWMMALGTCL